MVLPAGSAGTDEPSQQEGPQGSTGGAGGAAAEVSCRADSAGDQLAFTTTFPIPPLCNLVASFDQLYEHPGIGNNLHPSSALQLGCLDLSNSMRILGSCMHHAGPACNSAAPLSLSSICGLTTAHPALRPNEFPEHMSDCPFYRAVCMM